MIDDAVLSYFTLGYLRNLVLISSIGFISDEIRAIQLKVDAAARNQIRNWQSEIGSVFPLALPPHYQNLRRNAAASSEMPTILFVA